MTFVLLIGGIALLLFLGTLGMIEVGRQARRRSLARAPASAEAGLSALEGAIFTILGLLLAFTFSGAAGRFDERKQLVASEANSIGTAWLRLDLLQSDERSALRTLFRAYLDARLESYAHDVDQPEAVQARARTSALQSEIWSAGVAACPRVTGIAACTLLLPALNDMIDITTTRLAATLIHPPLPVYGMLLALVLATALLTGYGTGLNAERNWLHRLMFATAITAAVYVTLDLEYPRYGFIRVDAVDQLLVDLRQSFDE
jgi:hypothetical protein